MAALLATALAAAGIAASLPDPGLGKKTNVLFIVSDDLRPEMGCYGGDAITPNVDKLAASPGTVVFERAYVQQAICCPTRSSFLTGRRPDTTRVWDLHTHFRATQGSPANGKKWVTLPQYFKQNGYFTAGMGKVFHPVKDPATGLADDVGYSWSAPYYHPHGGCLGSDMAMCWNENANNSDSAFRDTMIAMV